VIEDNRRIARCDPPSAMNFAGFFLLK
jgi:hypothetical protein